MSLFILDDPISWAVLPRVSVRATPHRSSVNTVGNQSTRRKPAMLGRVKLDNTPLTCDQGNFNQIAAWSRLFWQSITFELFQLQYKSCVLPRQCPHSSLRWSTVVRHVICDEKMNDVILTVINASMEIQYKNECFQTFLSGWKWFH